MKAFLIVDPYGSGGKLVDAFRKKLGDTPDVAIVYVQSTLEPYSSMPVPAFEKYDDLFIFKGDLNEMAEAIKQKYDVVAVIAGQEPGVELADALSEHLGLASSNGTKRSAARRDKFEMVRTIAEAGLAAPKFIKTHDLSEILRWVQSETEYPVVLKSLRSAGTDGVYISQNETELREAFAKLIGSKSIYDDMNEQILVESFLKGEEYVVNAVSKDGEHYVTDVWKYRKKYIPGHGNVYDRETLLPVDLPEVQQLIKYNAQVLNALQINNGPSHAEIMLTPEGPVLVEVGARISGVVHQELYNASVGHNQVDLTIDCYADAENFMKTVEKLPYDKKQHAMIVNLVYEGAEGKLEQLDESIVSKIKSLSSVRELVIRIHEGETLKPTRTLVNSPARVFMGHADESQLLSDYEVIQEMQKQMFRIILSTTARPSAAFLGTVIPKPSVEEKPSDTEENTTSIVYS